VGGKGDACRQCHRCMCQQLDTMLLFMQHVALHAGKLNM
jgi:hypothetical protein